MGIVESALIIRVVGLEPKHKVVSDRGRGYL